jgi:hypothetical protein
VIAGQPAASRADRLPVCLLATAQAAADDHCRNFSWSIGGPIDLFDEPLPPCRPSRGKEPETR